MSGEAPDTDPWARLEEAAAGTPRGKTPKRERIVLAERRSTRRVVRTLAEVEEQTGIGEMLVRQLVRTQFALALRLMLVTVLVLGGIPLLLLLAPSLGAAEILGLRVPWLLLVLLIYPFFLVVGWAYNRGADRHEQDFTEMVEN